LLPKPITPSSVHAIDMKVWKELAVLKELESNEVVIQAESP